MVKADHKFSEVETDIRKSHRAGGRRKVIKADYQARGVMSLPDKSFFTGVAC